MRQEPFHQSLGEIIKELNISPEDSTAIKNAERLLHIKLSEGYTTDDIATVVKFYRKKWTGKMEKYFRPSTLFSNHFADYLEEARKQGRTIEPQSTSCMYSISLLLK